MLDEIAKEYFKSESDFAYAAKLYQEFIDACEKYDNYDDYVKYYESKCENPPSIEEMESLWGGEGPELRFHKYAKAMRLVRTGSAQENSNSNNQRTHEKESLRSMVKEVLEERGKSQLKSINISSAMEEFINNKKLNWKPNGDSERIYRKDIFPIFIDLNGDLKTGNLTKEHIVVFKNMILKLPVNRNKILPYRNLTLAELITLDIPQEHQIKNRTKSKYLEGFSSFLSWMYRNGYSIDGLTEPLKNLIKAGNPAYSDRNEYTSEDLRKLFNSMQYLNGGHREAYQFWVPLIGLFTGARENEICQLYLNDIYREPDTNILVFDFNENGDKTTLKSVKRSCHARLVPVHPQLIKLGLESYLLQLSEAKEERVFPDLSFRNKHKFADKFQRWFNRTYTNEGNCNITTEKTSFHSLRHTVINYLKHKAGIDENSMAPLIGQSAVGNQAATRYVKPADLKLKEEWIKKIDFSYCIDFSKIRQWNHHIFNKK